MTTTTKGIALVTGASTGIGAVYADRLAKRGYDLILTARDAKRLQALAARLRDETGRAAEVFPADLTDRADLARIEERLSGDAAITMLVNNAGMSLSGDVLTAPTADLEKLLALNVTAPTLLAAAAGRAFAARGHGAIINVASVLGLIVEFFDPAYSGTKAHILALSRGLSRELGPRGVHVQAVLPSATRTEIWARSGKDIDAMAAGTVMEVGEMVDAALAGFDRGESVTIPPLEDETLWANADAARRAMVPGFANGTPASRYRVGETIAA